MGNVGIFVAHSLAGIPNRPPITLLLRNLAHLRSWQMADRSLKLMTHGMTEVRKGFEVEILADTQDTVQPKQNSRHHPVEVPISPAQGTNLDVSWRTELIEKSSMPSERISRKHMPDVHSKPREVQSNGHVHAVSSLETVPSCMEYSTEESSDLLHDGRNTDNPLAYESVAESSNGPDVDDSIIYHLIVATKAPATAKSLRAYAHRLTRESTILFLQNGMGVIDEVNDVVFPDQGSRPQYMIGVNSHGLKRKDGAYYSAEHTGEGTIALGVMPNLFAPGTQPVGSNMAPSSRYLLRAMTRTPVFVAVGFPPTDLLQHQLDKLAVNAVINPLTAMLDVKNGALMSTFHLKRVTRLLLAEISVVLRSLPELQNVPNVNMRFDTVRLENLVRNVAESTASNVSSMLQDVRQNKQTEIDYINGYIIKRGEELGVHCVMNYMLMHMIKGKANLMDRAKKELLLDTPFAHFTGREEW